MARGYQVLEMLIPNGGWVLTGNDYEGIEFLTCDPISKEEFEAGFATVDAFIADREAKRAADKAALLERLGITEEEAQLLLG